MTKGSNSQREVSVTGPSPAVIEARVEQLARIERVLWSTPLAAEIEPWTTPGRVTATITNGDGRTGD